MIDWVIYITAGIIVGFAAGFFFSRLDTTMQKKCEELQQKLDAAHQEMTHYKQDVTQHFVKTSNLINNMTQSYRAVYDHMAEGATRLCSSSMIAQAKNQGELDIPTAKLIETESTDDERRTRAESNNAESNNDSDAQANINKEFQPETSVNMQQSTEAESDLLHESPPAETIIETPDTDNNSDTAATASSEASAIDTDKSTDTESPAQADGTLEADGSLEADDSLEADGSLEANGSTNTETEDELSNAGIQSNTLNDDDGKKDSTMMH